MSLTDDDGNTQTLTARTGTVAANAAPTASNGTVTTAKGAAYAFGASDFGYSDADGDALASVRIVTLPASGKGSLTLDGAAVSANDTVPAADIGASKLAYTPPANGHGTGYTSFTFKVSDGIAESASANTLTVDVTAVPGIPTGVSSTRGDGSAVLAWAAPADAGSSAIVKYQYRVSSDGGASWAVGWTDVPDSDDAGAGLHDETSVTVPDLDNDTAYTFLYPPPHRPRRLVRSELDGFALFGQGLVGWAGFPGGRSVGSFVGASWPGQQWHLPGCSRLHGGGMRPDRGRES